MKAFGLRLVAFLLIFILGDFFIGKILRHFRPVDYGTFIDSKKEFFERPQHLDALAIGDSHIADALDPRILRDSNNIAAFNLGIYHATPYENYYVLLSALEHLQEMPKVIILGTNPVMFTKTATPGKYTGLILQGVSNKWHLNYDARKSVDASFFLSTVRESYLFTSMFKRLSGSKYVPTREIKAVDNGYLEVTNQIPNQQWTNFKKTHSTKTINKTQIEYFNKMIELAQANHIEVWIVNPPIWSEQLKRDIAEPSFQEFSRVLENASGKYNVKIFNKDFQLLQDELQQSDYLNTEHLNYYGAKKFTLRLSTWIKENQTSHLQSHE